MRGTTTAASNLARAALVLGLIGGCSAPPADSLPASASPTAPASTETAPTSTAGPSAAAGLEITWQPIVNPGEWARMVYGAQGWVGLEACHPDGFCDEAATVWHSADLATWETIELPRSGDVIPVSLAANSDGYLVAATDFDEVGEDGATFLQVWRSPDGRAWERVGELPLGSCYPHDCPGVTYAGLAPNGAIVATRTFEDVDEYGQTYVTDDGVTWRETTIATSSRGNELDKIMVNGVRSTPTDLFLSGSGCRGNVHPCETIMWSTTDRVNWVEEQAFGDVDGVSVASDGIQRVATVKTCQTATECTTDVWTGLRGTSWTNVLPVLDLDYASVGWTGDAWVLGGDRGNQLAGDRRFVAYVSADASTWTTVPSDMLGGPGECGGGVFDGGPGFVVVAVPDCSLWKGIVQPAR